MLADYGKDREARREAPPPFRPRGKEFFNHCKLVVASALSTIGMPLVQEVFLAEATTRFYAGMYYSLRVCRWVFGAVAGLMTAVGIVNALWPELFQNLGAHFKSAWPWLHVIISLGAVVACIWVSKAIAKGFRILRLKEVDTVYEAYYLAQRRIESASDVAPK
jgi:hypothetical protein